MAFEKAPPNFRGSGIFSSKSEAPGPDPPAPPSQLRGLAAPSPPLAGPGGRARAPRALPPLSATRPARRGCPAEPPSRIPGDPGRGWPGGMGRGSAACPRPAGFLPARLTAFSFPAALRTSRAGPGREAAGLRPSSSAARGRAAALARPTGLGHWALARVPTRATLPPSPEQSVRTEKAGGLRRLALCALSPPPVPGARKGCLGPRRCALPPGTGARALPFKGRPERRAKAVLGPALRPNCLGWVAPSGDPRAQADFGRWIGLADFLLGKFPAEEGLGSPAAGGAGAGGRGLGAGHPAAALPPEGPQLCPGGGREAPSGPSVFLACLSSFIHKPGGYRRGLNIDGSPPTAPPLTQLQNSSRTVWNYLFPYSISISLIKSYNV